MALIVICIIGIIIINISNKKIREYDYRINMVIDIYFFLFIIWAIMISGKDLINGGSSIVYIEMILFISVFFYIKLKDLLTIYILTYFVYIFMIRFTGIRLGRVYPEIINSFAILLICLFVSYTKYLMAMKTHVHLKVIEEKNEKLQLMNEELYKLSILDPLTHLYNKQKLKEVSTQEYNKSAVNDTEIMYLMIDIDYYKRFNDTYGHIAGDECLKKISDKLYSIINEYNGYIGRYGGEEFLVILPNVDCVDSEHMLKELIEEVEKMKIKNEKSEVSNYVTISLGAYKGIPDKKDVSDDFIENADRALYKAKSNGRNRYVINSK
ncbi:GGDEF domain-containing protein [Oceanirhabdus seepicola]|uniref:GGDEF domain-containing protein n=1 Tax=Oceanirhabdus seepicola TaxID=2828781 RepID=A0A9J6NZD2_9CLOT|nr:GGDEF domain-containing protein [Oceanirhabdus seepicola]MCM1989794.1 GGDEF domain-containing protein [Oceanirhabdus seepicola]